MKSLEEGREWRLSDLLYTDDLVLCAKSNKVMVLGGEERLKCEICVDGTQLDQVSEFKYLMRVLD